jgi:hypothetical protein
MGPKLSPHKRRRNLWPDADQPPRFCINHRPSGIRPHDHLALGINKIHAPVKLRTLGFALDPTACRDAFTRYGDWELKGVAIDF